MKRRKGPGVGNGVDNGRSVGNGVDRGRVDLIDDDRVILVHVPKQLEHYSICNRNANRQWQSQLRHKDANPGCI